MRIRCRPTLWTVCTVVLLAPLPGAGQTGARAEGDTPRTAWGAPDLQGTWSYASLTPLERPAELADREFFSPEEAAARNEYWNVTRFETRPPPGSVGAYNSAWLDFGKVSPDRRTSLIVDPADGRLPLRADTERRLAARREYQRLHPADSWLDRTNWDRCITYHGVPPVSTGYNNTYQILQAPGYVAIRVEAIHDVRIIPLDGRPPLDGGIRQWNGSSRGHWEGATLVVETANFSRQTQHRFPSSPNTRAVERFRRVDANTIEHQFTIEDATVYTQPWTAVRLMPRLPGYVIYEYACHEGNYALPNILSIERALESQAAADPR